MQDILLSGQPQVAVKLRPSARAKRMTLRVSRLDGRVTLTLPKGTAQRHARAFVVEREAWIRKHLADQPEIRSIALGMQVPVLGQPRRIVAGSGRRVELRDTEIAVPGAPQVVARKLEAWLKATARSELAYSSDAYAQELGRSYSKLTMRDTRSRWGSCTTDGGLMYSWRLIMAPVEVLSYVAAHEVAHLQEMNHSPAFWAIVERLYGDYSAPRKWLRTQGHALHAYQFDS